MEGESSAPVAPVSEADIPLDPPRRDIAVNLAADKMVRQLTQLVLDHCRDEREGARLPWHLLPEDQQAELIDRVDRSVRVAVLDACNIIATNSIPAVVGTIEQVVVKDGLKVVCKAPFTDENLAALGRHVKGVVQLIVIDTDQYSGGEPLAPAPREPELPLGGGGEPPEDGGAAFDQTPAGSAIAAETPAAS